jgi:periplasmic protein CpxP/Spy
MKKIVLAICLVSSFMIQLAAQTPNPSGVKTEKHHKKQLTSEERAKRNADRAEKELSLSSDQKSKWEVAALNRSKANAPLQEKMKGCTTPEERKDIHKQMKMNKNDFHTTVTSMLTAEQKAKFEQMQQEKHGKHQHKGKGRRMDSPPQKTNSTE